MHDDRENSLARGPKRVGWRAWQPEAALVTFYFYDDVGEFPGSIQQELMGRFCRDAKQVSGPDLLANTALNGAIALLVRRNGFCVYQRAADKESRGTGLYKNKVRLGFMPLRLAVGFAVDQQGGLVGVIGELFNGEMMRV